MLSTTTAIQTFLQDFTTVITVSIDTTTNVSSVTSVVADFTDSGVVVTRGTSTVTLSGKYQAILPITWYWKDLNDQLQSGTSAPATGTYQKIIKLDSPPFLTKDCTYTITSAAGTDSFVHTVKLDSYDPLASELIALLATQP
jgi:hypothetical protein